MFEAEDESPGFVCFKEEFTEPVSKITALKAGKGRGKRVNIYLDGKYAFNLESVVAVREGLRVEQELSEERLLELTRSNSSQRCYNAAVRLLGYRPRSEPELTTRLRRSGFDEESITTAIEKLKQQGFVNDTEFAQFWKENRESFSPRSRQLTRLELKRKGISEDIINGVVESIDDDESAYRAGLKKARSLTGADYESFRRRLGDHLRRRGFGYGVITRAVSRIWQEMDNEPRD